MQNTVLSDEDLTSIYITANLDPITISEQLLIPKKVVKEHINKLGLVKTEEAEKASRESRRTRLKLAKNRSAVTTQKQRFRYTTAKQSVIFDCPTQLGYAMWLDSRSLEWYYRELSIPYCDSWAGDWYFNVIDFTIVGEPTEWVQMIHQQFMRPTDAFIATRSRAKAAGVNYRGYSLAEAEEIANQLANAKDSGLVELLYPKPNSRARHAVYWFFDESAAKAFKLDGWELLCIKRKQQLYQATYGNAKFQ